MGVVGWGVLTPRRRNHYSNSFFPYGVGCVVKQIVSELIEALLLRDKLCVDISSPESVLYGSVTSISVLHQQVSQ